MRRKMRCLRAVKRQAADAINIINRIRQMHNKMFDIGFKTFVISSGGTQEEISAPQCPKVKIQFTLSVDKQRATTFFLQYFLAISRFQSKVFDQVLQVATVSFGTKISPATQAGKR